MSPTRPRLTVAQVNALLTILHKHAHAAHVGGRVQIHVGAARWCDMRPVTADRLVEVGMLHEDYQTLTPLGVETARRYYVRYNGAEPEVQVTRQHVARVEAEAKVAATQAALTTALVEAKGKLSESVLASLAQHASREPSSWLPRLYPADVLEILAALR